MNSTNLVHQLEFLYAPILVTSNVECAASIEFKARKFAEAHDTCVIHWGKDIDNSWQSCPTEVEETIQSEACFWEYFISNARGYITQNMNQNGIVNGTPVTCHSLTFKTTQQQQQVLGLVQQATPGQVITLNEPPLSVNVILNKKTNENLSTAWKYGSLDRSKTTFIIPICFDEQNNNDANNQWKNCTVQTSVGGPCKAIIHDHFKLELAFATMVHKAQGKTFDKIVIVVDQKPHGMSQLTCAHFFVAMSRVQCAADICFIITPSDPMSELQYLQTLKPSCDIEAFFAGYNISGNHWTPTLALA